MSTQSIVPLHYDMEYITTKLRETGVTNHYGHTVKGEGNLLVYRAQDFDAVQAVLDAYPMGYAEEVLRPRLLAKAAAIRWEKQQTFVLNGTPMKSDPETISSVTAAVVLMGVNPDSPQSRRWKTGPRLEDWVTIDKATLIAIGTAAAAHVQACFDREEELMIALFAASTVDELIEIDVTVGWPE